MVRGKKVMEIADVKQHIKTGKLDKVYIFYGEEYAIIKLYLKMMSEKANLELTYADSVMDLMTGVRTKSLIQSHHLYVVMDDKEYLTNEKMQERFKGLKDDIVVLYYTNADKRLKFWKQNKDRAVEFSKLEPRVLTKYIQKELPLSDTNCVKLAEACDNDYGRVLLEIDKIKQYSEAIGDNSVNEFLKEMLETGVIYSKPRDAIFAFTDAVLARTPSKAYSLLQESKAVGEANLTLLSVLYNNFKTLLQVQSYDNYSALGLNKWQVSNVKAHTGNYSNGEIVKAMSLIREVERGIKTGSIPDDLSVDYVLVRVM